MTKPGGSQDEEAFRRALQDAKARGTVGAFLPALFACIAAPGALVLVFMYWRPLHNIPALVMLGAPIGAGVAAFLLVKKLV